MLEKGGNLRCKESSKACMYLSQNNGRKEGKYIGFSYYITDSLHIHGTNVGLDLHIPCGHNICFSRITKTAILVWLRGWETGCGWINQREKHFPPPVWPWLPVLVCSSVWQLWSLVSVWHLGSRGGIGLHKDLVWEWVVGLSFSWTFVRFSSWSKPAVEALVGAEEAEVWSGAWPEDSSPFWWGSFCDECWESE